MKGKLGRVIMYGLLSLLAILLFKIFWPRHFAVPQATVRESTRYWDLPTGSRIGYSAIAAKGNPQKTPIIYLHGGPGGSVSDREMAVLSPLREDGYDIYFYDQIGSGQSARLDHIEEYTVDRHIRDLEAIIGQIGAEKVILLGQSWGAVLAVLFTAAHPEVVEKIVFTSPGPIYPLRPELQTVSPPDSLHLRTPIFSNRQGNEKTNTLRSRAMAYWATHFHKKLATDKEADDFAIYRSYEVNKSTVCDTAKIVPARAGSGFYAGLMTMESLGQVPDPRPKLMRSDIPILVLKGQCDNQKWGFTNEYLTLFPNSHFQFIPDAGHFLTVEQPELYFNAIRDFLQK